MSIKITGVPAHAFEARCLVCDCRFEYTLDDVNIYSSWIQCPHCYHDNLHISRNRKD